MRDLGFNITQSIYGIADYVLRAQRILSVVLPPC
jgi:hypothetical protein